MEEVTTQQDEHFSIKLEPENLHDFQYSNGELGGASLLSFANANSSPKYRRRARIMVFIAFGIPIILVALFLAKTVLTG